MTDVAPSREGAVELLLPPSPTTAGPARRRPVFYNAAMALDRDLNVALVRAATPHRTDLVGLDLLAATGVRGLRLLRETGRFTAMVLADRLPQPAAVLARNAARFPGAWAVRADARRPPFRAGAFDYVDLDPFGTPAPFVGPALDLVQDGGLFAVTATDMPVLAGVARGVAERRYGGRTVRGRFGPEAGLRLLLAFLATSARRSGRSVRPVAAYVHDHHVRAILRIVPAEGAGPDPIGTLDPATQPGPALPPGPPLGPLWLGPLFDPGVLGEIRPPDDAARASEVRRWIELLREEAGVDAPFYYEVNELARRAHWSTPPSPGRLCDLLRAHGFRAARTHARPGAVRTDAPRTEVERLGREARDRAGTPEQPPPRSEK